MEEKERFELWDDCGYIRIYDNVEDRIYKDRDLDYLADLLNEQDKIIKELKKSKGE